jgi:hypothetical protein
MPILHAEPLGAQSGYKPADSIRLKLSYSEDERQYSINIYHYCDSDQLYYIRTCLQESTILLVGREYILAILDDFTDGIMVMNLKLLLST